MGLDGTGILTDMDADTMESLGGRVKDARERKGWSKEHASRVAGISTITWKRVEDGLRVHDVKLKAAMRTVGLLDEDQAKGAGDAVDLDEMPPTMLDISRLSDRDRGYLLAMYREMRRAEGRPVPS